MPDPDAGFPPQKLDPAFFARDPDIQAFPVPDHSYLFFDEPILVQESFPNALLDFTFPTHDWREGFRVLYISADGTTTVWYPGRSEVVGGRWRLSVDQEKFCVHDDELQRFEATNLIEGEYWLCTKLSKLREGELAVAVLPGDPFDLQAGAVAPYLRTKCQAPPEFDISGFPAGRFGNCRI